MINKKEMIVYMKESFEHINVFLSAIQLEQFYLYYQLLIEKNKVMNLTAITNFEEVVQKHFIDSIMLKHISFLKESAVSLIDVGTGAGFPGIPLKIVYPELTVTLLDSLNKRVNFLNEVIEKLSLKDIFTIHGRAEDIGILPAYREKFDYSVSRAVANLSVLSEYCLPFVKIGGYFIAYKSGSVQEELNLASKPIQILSGKLKQVELFDLPMTDMRRTLIYIEKISLMNKRFPRKAGLPAKEPIK